MLEPSRECDLKRRAGRKRKGGKRHPGGQLIKPQIDLKTRTSRQPHRRGLKDELRADERAESPLGRLMLREAINNDEYDAGARYAFLVGEYRATIGAPRTGAGSGRGFECLAVVIADLLGKPGSLRGSCGDEESCACLRRRKRYEDAFEALGDAGRGALMAVNRVSVQGAEPAAEEIVYLVAGLRALARHFGLTGGPRRAHYQNAH